MSDAAKTELAELQRKHRALAGEVKRSASSSSGASNKRCMSIIQIKHNTIVRHTNNETYIVIVYRIHSDYLANLQRERY